MARIDLDLREIDILMQMNAYKAAEEIYMYGKNVEGSNGGSLSISQIATTSERSIVPQYDAFYRFYDDNTFVDKSIRAALRGDGIWSGEQRRTIVLKSSQAIVMFFGGLQAAYEAVSDCSASVQSRSTGGSSKTDAWDRAAAFFVGSLEGTEPNGSSDGYLFYSLAQEQCEAFGTCDDDTATVEVNEKLIDLLYSGRGAVLGNSCNGLRKVAEELSTLLLVPTIQGALITSIRLSENIVANSSLRRAEAYVYSRALLPIVDDINRDAASVIAKNMGDRSPASVKHISSDVFSAFASVYPGMGVDCELIGETDGFDPCAGVVYGSSSAGSRTMWILVGVAIAGLLVGAWFFRRRLQGKKSLPENNPKFVASPGEFNNHSMNLLEKAFSNNTAPNTPEETSRLTGGFSDPEIHAICDDDDFDEAEALKSRIDSTPDII